MADENSDGFDPETATGGQLRERYEAALAANRDLEGQLGTLRAQQVIDSGELHLVQPDDLKGVPLDQIETKAAEIQSDRKNQAEELIRTQLKSTGLDGDALEAQVATFMSGPTEAGDNGAGEYDAARAASSIGGTPVASQNNSHLRGNDALLEGLKQSAASRS